LGFQKRERKGQGSEKEAIKEIIALQSDEGSTAGAETIQSSSSSSGPDSSSLRKFWLRILRVRDSLEPLAGTDFRFIWLAAPSASALPHGSLSKRPGAWRSSWWSAKCFLSRYAGPRDRSRVQQRASKWWNTIQKLMSLNPRSVLKQRRQRRLPFGKPIDCIACGRARGCRHCGRQGK